MAISSWVNPYSMPPPDISNPCARCTRRMAPSMTMMMHTDLEAVEKHMREIYAPFGDLSDENWRHPSRFGARRGNVLRPKLARSSATVVSM